MNLKLQNAMAYATGIAVFSQFKGEIFNDWQKKVRYNEGRVK